MTGDPPPTPQAIHNFDEAHTMRNRQLDDLIQSAVEARKDYRRDITVAGVAHYLNEKCTHKAVAELLSCAIERLIEAGDTAQRKQVIRCVCHVCIAHRFGTQP
jgi:hypothetical protein